MRSLGVLLSPTATPDVGENVTVSAAHHEVDRPVDVTPAPGVYVSRYGRHVKARHLC